MHNQSNKEVRDVLNALMWLICHSIVIYTERMKNYCIINNTNKSTLLFIFVFWVKYDIWSLAIWWSLILALWRKKFGNSSNTPELMAEFSHQHSAIQLWRALVNTELENSSSRNGLGQLSIKQYRKVQMKKSWPPKPVVNTCGYILRRHVKPIAPLCDSIEKSKEERIVGGGGGILQWRWFLKLI